MSRVPTVRKADLDRVFASMAKAGQGVASIIVRPGGEVEITPLTVNSMPTQGDDFAAWREKRARRAAQGS